MTCGMRRADSDARCGLGRRTNDSEARPGWAARTSVTRTSGPDWRLGRAVPRPAGPVAARPASSHRGADRGHGTSLQRRQHPPPPPPTTQVAKPVGTASAFFGRPAGGCRRINHTSPPGARRAPESAQLCTRLGSRAKRGRDTDIDTDTDTRVHRHKQREREREREHYSCNLALLVFWKRAQASESDVGARHRVT